MKRRRKNGDPYNTVPNKPDPWKHEPVKKDRRLHAARRKNPLFGVRQAYYHHGTNTCIGDKKLCDRYAPSATHRSNPARASVIYAQRKGNRGEVMYYDGRKFTNNNPPKYFGTHDRARGVAQQLVERHSVLSSYRVWVGPPLHSLRRRNPESRGLEEAAKRLEDFSGHAARKVITVRSRSQAREGLIIGELDLIGYRTKRVGINGGRATRYAHDFGRGSRPLLAVSKDGKQLHIVGGRYDFTEAGIEDR